MPLAMNGTRPLQRTHASCGGVRASGNAAHGGTHPAPAPAPSWLQAA
ncbi:otthump00000028750 [Burkholderia pseudomallei 305]|nr:otthump00000028750 [Burkholderia pseudomallei 305]EEH26967.1 conserved hypothetical protein [Burkholderia pseudomallei Pakistan 9]EEP51389.1 conserved hypothetical protein [Burkholderia pseudomallei MSHR346]